MSFCGKSCASSLPYKIHNDFPFGDKIDIDSNIRLLQTTKSKCCTASLKFNLKHVTTTLFSNSNNYSDGTLEQGLLGSYESNEERKVSGLKGSHLEQKSGNLTQKQEADKMFHFVSRLLDHFQTKLSLPPKLFFCQGTLSQWWLLPKKKNYVYLIDKNSKAVLQTTLETQSLEGVTKRRKKKAHKDLLLSWCWESQKVALLLLHTARSWVGEAKAGSSFNSSYTRKGFQNSSLNELMRGEELQSIFKTRLESIFLYQEPLFLWLPELDMLLICSHNKAFSYHIMSVRSTLLTTKNIWTTSRRKIMLEIIPWMHDCITESLFS